MLLPIRHENMSARRWPIITFALIAINVVAFLATYPAMEEQGPRLSEVKAHVLILAAMHPDLNLPPEEQQLVASFKEHNPNAWTEIQQPNREVFDAWDAKIREETGPQALQSEMDSLATQYSQLEAASIAEKYAFVPAHPQPLAYITANFLHGGWLHLIGNMWFLWLAGFVLEDAWGRSLYSIVYFIAGAAALQFHAWANPGSIVPALGASGAVAALMGAFLVRFPKMKIEMAWLFFFRFYRFKAPAYTLLPLWLLMEVFYGTLSGQSGGVAHWAHVGGFAFGVLAALALQHSGLEQKANQAIEAELSWAGDPVIEQANELIDKGRQDGAIDILNDHLEKNPGSVDACSLLQQIYWRRNELPEYREVTVRLCEMHLKARDPELAWQDYEDFVNSGGEKMPAGTWFNLARAAEEHENWEWASCEYQKLAAAYPTDRHSLPALMAAGRICLKHLDRPQDALQFFQTASASAGQHLDWEQSIQTGIREAKAALSSHKTAPAAKQNSFA